MFKKNLDSYPPMVVFYIGVLKKILFFVAKKKQDQTMQYQAKHSRPNNAAIPFHKKKTNFTSKQNMTKTKTHEWWKQK